MAKVYLDTNIVIDCVAKRRNTFALQDKLNNHTIYISPLSVHILFYSYKIRVPSASTVTALLQFQIIDLSSNVLDKSLEGPSEDLEDNIQLHSAAAAECDVFLTEDKKLLAMKFFGKTKIVESL